MTGVEVAKSLAANRELKCHVVFVTAFDQYAVEAFETDAVDYVLKPYTEERLQAAVERLQARLGAVPEPPPQDLEGMLMRLSAKLSPHNEQLKWIKASVGQNLRLIPIEDVLFFQSDEKYTLVATKEFDALIRTPIKEILEGIDAARYWQIHRSTIVNASAIESVCRAISRPGHGEDQGPQGKPGRQPAVFRTCSSRCDRRARAHGGRRPSVQGRFSTARSRQYAACRLRLGAAGRVAHTAAIQQPFPERAMRQLIVWGLLGSCMAVAPLCQAAEQTRTLPDFKSISSKGAFKLVVEVGPKQSLTLKGD